MTVSFRLPSLKALSFSKSDAAGDDGADKLERGEAGPAERNAWRGTGRSCVQGVESCVDLSAWRTLGRRIKCFRFANYLDICVSIASLVVAITLAARHTSAKVQIPYVSIILAILALFLPWIGVVASFKQNKNTIMLVSAYSLGYNVIFTVLQYIYLYKAVDEAFHEDFLPETIVSSLRLVVGLSVCIFGHLCYRKLSLMRANRRSVLVVGLDGSGKSLIVDNLLPQQLERVGSKQWEINPTAGIQLHEFTKFESFWRVWDCSGNGRARALWRYYYSAVHAIVFVVDASDIGRLKVVKEEFDKIVESPEVRAHDPLFLILLNKCDLPEERKGKQATSVRTINILQLRRVLGLDALQNRIKSKVLAVSALLGNGIDEGFQWILDGAS